MAYSTGKTTFWKIAFLLSSLSPRKYSDNKFGQLPPLPPSRGAVRIQELLSERILVMSAPPNKRRAVRQTARSAKFLSHKFFGVPFLSLIRDPLFFFLSSLGKKASS